MRPDDTSADAAARQIAAFRAMTPQERLRLAETMSAEVRTLARAGVRSRRPSATPDEIDAAVDEIILGRDLAARARRHASGAE